MAARPKPSGALDALCTHSYPVEEDVWGSFWDKLGAGELPPGEALAVVASLTSRLPDGETVAALLRSLRERNPQPDPPSKPTVNIVGTGGGPSTFNLSTASAFVGAACGARVIKTGSRAYASKSGSIDMLNRLGVPLTDSYEETEQTLEEFGIACAGPFVYPNELTKLARSILPYGMKTVGRFFNVIGPFLAAIPVTTQITGVSDHSWLPMFRELVGEDSSRRYWITSNDLGVDELLSIEPSQVYDSEKDEEFTLDPSELGLGNGSFDEMKPVENLDDSMDHFMALIGGEGPPAAVESIRLNGAALALNAGMAEDWPAALELARQRMEGGEPAKLIERLRAHSEAQKAGAASSG